MLSLVLATSCPSPTTGPATPPNVIIIYCDDLGYGEVGSYGQKRIPTPNIDRLASEGIKFTRYYTASPVCAPSRASLMTGKHSGHSPIRGNKETGGWGLNDGEGQMSLPAAEFTLAEGFQSSGYATACVGKWGLGGPMTEGHPNNQGFDYFFGYLCQRRAHNLYPSVLWENAQVYQLLGNPYTNVHEKQPTPPNFAAYTGKQYAPRECLDKALAWIDRQNTPLGPPPLVGAPEPQARLKPFFLYYATVLPHVSLQAPLEDVAKFSFSETPHPGGSYAPCEKPRATYAAMVAHIDKEVGAIMEKVGKRENTLVIFTSDNGTTFLKQVDATFFNSLGEFRGYKSSCWEGGIRVPFIAHWPAQIPKGAESKQVAYACDLLPTLGNLAGFKAKPQDGRDLYSVLLGGATQTRDRLYFEFPEGEAFQAVIIRDRWKAITPRLRQGNRKIEIYDLDLDPGEKTNLAASQGGLVAEAQKIFDREHRPNRDFPLPGIDRPASGSSSRR